MTQYLLSVHMVEGEPVPADEEMQRMFRQVDEFNQQVMDSGAWVFAGGLHPPTSATVVRAQGGEVITTDGPFAETKEQLGGFWILEASDPMLRWRWPRGDLRPPTSMPRGAGRPGVGRLHGARRGPALPGHAGGLGGP